MRTRFAPAPTGFLHLGHVVNAIYVWGLAQARRGEVVLRVEDHDRQRARPEFERALLDDLDWLGFRPDIHPTDAFRSGRCDGRQSDRDAVYRDALAGLVERGLVYGCDCTRKQVESGVYPGACRMRGLPLRDGIGWRVRIEEHEERFVDQRLGPQRQTPAQQCGDILVRDRLGNWTYQFVATVDDHRQRVDLVIRGVDLLASTGRQIRIARLLGRRAQAEFRHHPLIMKTRDQKLSKSDGDTGVRDLRAQGWTPDRVRAAARLVGGLGDLAASFRK